MFDDFLSFAEDIGKGMIIGTLLCLVIFLPAILFGRW